MARSLANAVDATARAWLPALQRRALVGVRDLDDEIVAVQTVIRLRVRNRRAEHLLDVRRRCAGAEGENRPRLGNRATANVVEHEPRLAGRRPHPLRLGAHALTIVCCNGAHVRFFTWAWRSPEWLRNVRVGANSPSL